MNDIHTALLCVACLIIGYNVHPDKCQIELTKGNTTTVFIGDYVK